MNFSYFFKKSNLIFLFLSLFLTNYANCVIMSCKAFKKNDSNQVVLLFGDCHVDHYLDDQGTITLNLNSENTNLRLRAMSKIFKRLGKKYFHHAQKQFDTIFSEILNLATSGSQFLIISEKTDNLGISNKCLLKKIESIPFHFQEFNFNLPFFSAGNWRYDLHDIFLIWFILLNPEFASDMLSSYTNPEKLLFQKHFPSPKAILTSLNDLNNNITDYCKYRNAFQPLFKTVFKETIGLTISDIQSFVQKKLIVEIPLFNTIITTFLDTLSIDKNSTENLLEILKNKDKSILQNVITQIDLVLKEYFASMPIKIKQSSIQDLNTESCALAQESFKLLILIEIINSNFQKNILFVDFEIMQTIMQNEQKDIIMCFAGEAHTQNISSYLKQNNYKLIYPVKNISNQNNYILDEELKSNYENLMHHKSLLNKSNLDRINWKVIKNMFQTTFSRYETDETKKILFSQPLSTNNIKNFIKHILDLQSNNFFSQPESEMQLIRYYEPCFEKFERKRDRDLDGDDGLDQQLRDDDRDKRTRSDDEI